MTASEKFSGYSIQIGSEDIIDSKVLSLIAEDAEGNVDTGKAERKLLDVLKETRVRIGTSYVPPVKLNNFFLKNS